MNYTEVMDKVKELKAEFTVTPCVGYIIVSLENIEGVMASSNIGWYSFRDNPIESFIVVYEQYTCTKFRAALEDSKSHPSNNGSG